MVYVSNDTDMFDKSKCTEEYIDISHQIKIINTRYEKLNHNLKFRNILFSILFCTFFVGIIFAVFISISNSSTVLDGGPFITQSLIGDSIGTWASWNFLDSEDTLHVHIINQANLSEQKMEIVKNTILSEDTIEINDLQIHKGTSDTSTKFYVGWYGAIKELTSVELKNTLPITFHVHESTIYDGDIVITLSNTKNTEGYSGYTRSIIDESQNQILKSFITIYEVNKLESKDLDLITKHEMGHALGLKHSTDPEDLMYEQMTTSLPFISTCDVNALKSLYKDEPLSEFLCEK